MEQIVKAYEELGKKWVAGTVEIESFNCGCGSKEAHKLNPNCKGMWLNDKQMEFVNSKEPELLICGGYRSGKTVGMIIKMFLLSMFFPGNRILLGRKTRSDIESATLPAVFDIFPVGTYNYKVGPGIIEFPNGSQILLYGLDTSVSGDDTKKNAQKIKGLDLGGVFIDQLEEVEEMMYVNLTGRMSRNVPFRQMAANTNPANFWGYDYFKVNPRVNTHLIEIGMIDNKENLPEGFIESQLTRGELYVKRFVYGQWDKDSMVEGTVFPKEYIDKQIYMVSEPLRIIDGLHIYAEPKTHEYQIGVDPSTGAEDPCAIMVVDKDTGELVASYRAFVPTNVITEKTVQLAMMYSLSKKPLVVPEATGIGQALIEDLKKVYSRIYEREVFSQREKKTSVKLGFYTNYATKSQLIEHMKNLFNKNFPKIRDKAIIEEMRTFIYTDEASRQGAGAINNSHDDRIMAMMLAYWNIAPITLRETNILDRFEKRNKNGKINYQYN